MDKFFNFLVSIAVLSCPVRARSYNNDFSYERPHRHLGFEHHGHWHKVPKHHWDSLPYNYDSGKEYERNSYEHVGRHYPKDIPLEEHQLFSLDFKQYIQRYLNHRLSKYPQNGFGHDDFHGPVPDFEDYDQKTKGENDDCNHQVKWGHDWVFPDEHDRFSSTTKPSTTSSSPTRHTTSTMRPTTQALSILLCMRSCPVTPEYNPVCGSNDITYSNPGRLECAKSCGVDVVLQRFSACPPPTPPTESTSSVGTNVESTQTTTPMNAIINTNPPTIKPTRFTTIGLNPPTTGNPSSTGFTVSPDVLASIFTNSPESDEDATFVIDIRQKEEEPSNGK